MGESPWSDTAVRRREREREREEVFTRGPPGGGRGVEEIVQIRRSPSLGRCGRRLHPAASRRQSVNRDQTA